MKPEILTWDMNFVCGKQGQPVFGCRYVGHVQSCAHNRDRLAPDRVVEVVLGGTPFVSVMQTADFRNRNNLADRLYRPRVR